MAPGQVLAEDREDAGWSTPASLVAFFLPGREGQRPPVCCYERPGKMKDWCGSCWWWLVSTTP